MTDKRPPPPYPTLTERQQIAAGQSRPTQPRRYLNGSWPLLDGNIYPRITGKPPLGGYEGYVRRSPPATD